MKYDPIELMKLDITEGDIQLQRDACLKALTTEGVRFFELPMAYVYLPFIVDMFNGYKITITPFFPHICKIEIELK